METYQFADRLWRTEDVVRALQRHYGIDVARYPFSWRWRVMRKCYEDRHSKSAKGAAVTRRVTADVKMLCACAELSYDAKRQILDLIEQGAVEERTVVARTYV